MKFLVDFSRIILTLALERETVAGIYIFRRICFVRIDREYIERFLIAECTKVAKGLQIRMSFHISKAKGVLILLKHETNSVRS